MRVFSRKHEHIFLTRATQADFAAHARQGRHRSTNIIFNALLARALAALAQENRERGFADLGRARGRKRIGARSATADGGVNALDVLDLGQEFASGFCGVAGLGQGRARWQFKVHLGLRVVIRRNKTRRQQGNQHDGADKKRGRSCHGDPAVGECPAAGL